MAEEKLQVLISRTKVDKDIWLLLNDLAEALTKSTGTDVSRQMLVNLAFKSLLRYYERFLERPEKPAREEDILRAAQRTMPRTSEGLGSMRGSGTPFEQEFTAGTIRTTTTDMARAMRDLNSGLLNPTRIQRPNDSIEIDNDPGDSS